MIVAYAKCKRCDDDIPLDDEYGWNRKDGSNPCILCESCFDAEREELEQEQEKDQIWKVRTL